MSARTAAATALLAMAAVTVVTVAGNYPTFEGATEFRDMMVPAGASVGSLIYRLRASDHDKDYPLYFQATGTRARVTYKYTVLLFRFCKWLAINLANYNT